MTSGLRFAAGLLLITTTACAEQTSPSGGGGPLPRPSPMGPPSDANGWTLSVTCASSLETAVDGQWVCEHRDPSIRAMVSFRRVVAGTDITHWWDNGANVIAFSRGEKGIVAINRETVALDTRVATGLPPGTYCDLLTGGVAGATCAGTIVVVDSTDAIQLNLNPMTAIAIHTGTRL